MKTLGLKKTKVTLVHLISLRLSDRELQMLEALATQHGMSRTAYIRMLIHLQGGDGDGKR